jgi:hypothetical protein
MTSSSFHFSILKIWKKQATRHTFWLPPVPLPIGLTEPKTMVNSKDPSNNAKNDGI